MPLSLTILKIKKMTEILLITILVILITILVISTTAIYFLIPAPFLSYQQGEIETDFGVITEIRKMRFGTVYEVALKNNLEVVCGTAEGKIISASASLTTFIHLRIGQTLPKIGDKISVLSINRLHLFTGRSFNWVKNWKLFEGEIPDVGKLSIK